MYSELFLRGQRQALNWMEHLQNGKRNKCFVYIHCQRKQYTFVSKMVRNAQTVGGNVPLAPLDADENWSTWDGDAQQQARSKMRSRRTCQRYVHDLLELLLLLLKKGSLSLLQLLVLLAGPLATGIAFKLLASRDASVLDCTIPVSKILMRLSSPKR